VESGTRTNGAVLQQARTSPSDLVHNFARPAQQLALFGVTPSRKKVAQRVGTPLHARRGGLIDSRITTFFT
jgi:hypothetical protein